MDANKKVKALKSIQAFAKDKSCLIVEATSSGRTLFKRILVNMGFDNKDIHMAQDCAQANELLEKVSPDIFVFSYEFGRDKCIDFLNLHIQKKASRLSSAFIVTSENNSLSFSSMMMELEVDLFFSKPYTVQSIEDGLFNLLMYKAKPSKNLKVLEHGRELYLKKDYEKGLEHFEKYDDLKNYAPSAEYYKGKMYTKINKLDEAEQALKKGVELKPDHYKCLITICDLFVKQKKYPEAYNYFEKLLQNYPVSPNHICSLIRVAIFNHKFEDIIGLSDLFSELKESDDITKLHISAGLAISSRFLIENEQKDRALKVLDNAADFCLGKKEILKEIVSQLISIGNVEAADKIFTKFSEGQGESVEFKLMSLEINSQVYEPERVLREASEMLREGLKEPLVYTIAIEASIKLGRPTENVEDLVFEAKRIHPNLSSDFEKYLEDFQKAQ